MKIEIWNKHQIRLDAFLNEIEVISGGKYLDITKSMATLVIEQSFSNPCLYKCDDGRLLAKTLWNEIEGIDVRNPFPVFVDITKAYGVVSESEFQQIIHPYEEREEVFRDGVCGVYIIKAIDMNIYKIGCSMNIQSRINQIRNMSPVGIKLIGVIETDDQYELESKFHNFFANKKDHGEWFGLEDKDIPELFIKIFKITFWDYIIKIKYISSLNFYIMAKSYLLAERLSKKGRTKPISNG